jgi:putative flippase GtrA
MTIPNGEIRRFILTGMLNTLFGYAAFGVSYYLLHHETGALLLSYTVGILFNYRTYATYVFNQSEKQRFFPFVLVYVFTFWLNDFLLIALMDQVGLSAYVAQLMAVTVIAPILYLLNKKFVFV